METIHVFKTNIQCPLDVKRVGVCLQTAGVDDWNVDLQDVDCVLRVVSDLHSESELMLIVQEAGFFCCELD